MCSKLFQLQNSKLSAKTGVNIISVCWILKLLVTYHVFIFSPFAFPIIHLLFTNTLTPPKVQSLKFMAWEMKQWNKGYDIIQCINTRNSVDIINQYHSVDTYMKGVPYFLKEWINVIKEYPQSLNVDSIMKWISTYQKHLPQETVPTPQWFHRIPSFSYLRAAWNSSYFAPATKQARIISHILWQNWCHQPW